MIKFGIIFMGLVLSGIGIAEANNIKNKEAKAKLFGSIKFLYVGELDKPKGEFTADDDVNSIEIVFINKDSKEISSVSKDGQVIFLRLEEKDKMMSFLDEAFDNRLKQTAK